MVLRLLRDGVPTTGPAAGCAIRPVTSLDAQQAVVRSLHQDLATALARLQEARTESRLLRHRLRRILNCDDPKCCLCAACLDVVRDA